MLNPDQEKRFAEALVLDAADALANLDDRGLRNACARIREVNSYREPLPEWLSRDLCRDYAAVMDRMADAINNATTAPALKLVACPETPPCEDCEAEAHAKALGLPASADLSDDEIDALAAVGALEDTIDGALDDASDQLAAEHLGVPLETFKAALARASESTADQDQAERFVAFSEAVRDFRLPAGRPENEWPAGVATN